MVAAFFLGGLARKAKLNPHAELDPDLAVAIETAKRSLPQFIEKLRNPPPDASAFAIKVAFVESGRAEMMWVDHLTYGVGAFVGTLADSPFRIKKLHRGDRVRAVAADVVDWEIFYHTPDGDLHEGAETDRVLRRRQAGRTLRYPPRMSSSGVRNA